MDRLISKEERSHALEQFHKTPLENLRHGLGVMTQMQWINLEAATAVGKTQNELSGHSKKDEIIFCSLEEFLGSGPEEFKEALHRHFNSRKYDDITKFDHLHTALCEINILVIPESFSGSLTLDRAFEGNTYNHLMVLCMSNDARLFLNTKKTHDTGPAAQNTITTNISTDFIDILCREGTSLEVVELRNLKDNLVYSRKDAVLDKDSSIKWTTIECPSRLNITEHKAVLIGENSRSVLNTLVIAKGSEFNIKTITRHLAKNTKSLMQARSILKKSKAVLKGLVYIDQNAPDSDGYQKTDFMVLDEESRAISIPDLKIHNDQVRCTHGSSISRPDIEKMFYLESRGLRKQDSEKILIEGFYEKILKDIMQEVKEVVNNEIKSII